MSARPPILSIPTQDRLQRNRKNVDTSQSPEFAQVMLNQRLSSTDHVDTKKEQKERRATAVIGERMAAEDVMKKVENLGKSAAIAVRKRIAAAATRKRSPADLSHVTPRSWKSQPERQPKRHRETTMDQLQ